MSATGPAASAGGKAALVARLLGIVPARGVLHEDEDVVPYECDGLSAYRQRPMIVVLPDDEAQVAAVVRLCRDLAVPVVARGAGTGLSGGALPRGDGVLLSLARLSRILDIDPLARTDRKSTRLNSSHT